MRLGMVMKIGHGQGHGDGHKFELQMVMGLDMRMSIGSVHGDEDGE